MPQFLLASVLKPVDDTRMFGKFARTLVAAGAQVAVAGRASTAAPANASASDASPTPYVLFEGTRLSLGRLAAQGRYWRLLHQLRPALVVVHAPELLPLTLLWQRLGRGRQFIYDVQENYGLNIRSQGVYPAGLRALLAGGLRWVESLAARHATAVVLAEASYAAELPFLDNLPSEQVLILENKYQPQPGEVLPRAARPLPTEPLRLLYSGTISELNGVREAIALARQLRLAWPGGVGLTIIGFCQQPALLADLQRLAAAEASWLTLVGGAELVPHAQVVAAMEHSHLGLLPYRPHPSTERCRPTKLFEYLAHGLPVLVPPNPLWVGLVQAHQAGLVVDFAQPVAAAAQVAAAVQTTAFYPTGPPTTAVLWHPEGKKLRHLLESFFPSPTFAPPSA
ncbi:glycosyltransferase [Hymenobacter sp. HMF4947]|uniref:Glycosyltransferase n=1 Tax=Hymenobacter ginkgonis TaxID=2682976 RepID=A0A7K1TG19_9BACT|nr:glycosyltransferase [Hymenobacter ginkgonis]MVN77262.1 glycosyltransferase [Hymenobacter ginkgonis]